MPSLRPIARAVMCSTLVIASACGSDATSPSRVPQPLDLDALIRETSLPGSGGARGPRFAQQRSTAASCVYSTAARAFTCAPVTVHGLTMTRSFTLYDAAGNAQSLPDGGTTASMHSVTTASGVVTRTMRGGSMTMTVNRHEEMTLSGINTAHHMLNGTASSSTSSTMTMNGAAHSMTSIGADTVRNLVLASSTTGARHWPLSGSVVHWQTPGAGRGVGAVAHGMHQQITYNGTSVATIVSASDRGSLTCTRDLATGMAPGCSSRSGYGPAFAWSPNAGGGPRHNRMSGRDPNFVPRFQRGALGPGK